MKTVNEAQFQKACTLFAKRLSSLREWFGQLEDLAMTDPETAVEEYQPWLVAALTTSARIATWFDNLNPDRLTSAGRNRRKNLAHDLWHNMKFLPDGVDHWRRWIDDQDTRLFACKNRSANGHIMIYHNLNRYEERIARFAEQYWMPDYPGQIPPDTVAAIHTFSEMADKALTTVTELERLAAKKQWGKIAARTDDRYWYNMLSEYDHQIGGVLYMVDESREKEYRDEVRHFQDYIRIGGWMYIEMSPRHFAKTELSNNMIRLQEHPTEETFQKYPWLKDYKPGVDHAYRMRLLDHTIESTRVKAKRLRAMADECLALLPEVAYDGTA